ncbi:hypothetical protein SETIT_5G304400v2 [Setaria italica]|uniref:Uncharacterized protein n=2 Tax=Setaria italica TaxID=4555 RepID=A0A368RAE7_SETIT|nr:uncharacterized protein LOC101755566 [Setaria italica]RCV27185.1 hypothetical protein SETIT_5G304400v2 [Setaria italica]
MAKASAAEPFSIRGFATRMRAVDAAACYPFGGDGACWVEGEPPLPFPPMDPTPRSRWWKHELAAVRARLSAGSNGGEAATAGGEGGGLRRGTKRKESRSGSAAERAKKRRRMLQFRSFLKNKEKTSKPQSTSRLHQHMLHMALLRKHRSSTVCTRTEHESRKKLDEAWDCILLHESSVNNQSRERMDPCNEMHSNLFWRKELNSSVNKQGIEVSESTNCPANTGCEVVVKHATGPKDDIFGDLPLLELESSKTMFRTGVDELPTVIEESFITSQSEADSIPEAVPLRLIDASDITVQTPSPLVDLVKSEVNPHNEPAFISHSDVAGSRPSTVRMDGLPHHKNISVMEPDPGNMQLKFNGSALSTNSDLRSKCGSRNPLQGCSDANKNCSKEIKKHSTSSTSSPAMRTRTEATKCKDALVKGKKSTDIAAVVALPAPMNHLSSQVSVLPSAVSQGVFSTRTNADDMSSFRSMPAKECIPSTRPFGMPANECVPSTRPSGMPAKECIPSARPSGIPAKECIPCTRPSGNFRSNVDPCVPLSTNNQGSWSSKPHLICSPANIGMAFMKLPGLERMEISNCNVEIGEKKYRNAQSMNTVRFQKQQLVSGMTNAMQGQKKIGLSNSQAGKTVLDGCLGQGDHHLQQPTVRLMGKTVSVCNRSKDHNVPTMGKVSPDNIPIESNYLSTAFRQLPQKRSFPCQDSVIPRVHINDSSDFLARIPNNNVSGQNTSFSGLHNQKLQPKNTASPTTKDCTWNFGSQFPHQAELNNATMVSANSKTRHLELRQPPHLTSIPQNQQSQMWTPASHMSRKDHSFVGSAANQCSPAPQLLIKASMKEKYQKSTLLSYDDPSSVPIRQPYQIPGEKLSSASAISFLDYGVDNSLSRSSSPGLSLSLTTGFANKSVSIGRPTCMVNLTNTDGRNDAGFADPISNGPAYTENVSQQPAKRQLVTDRQDFMSMDLNIASHSPGWSLSDAVGPRVLDFSKRTARDVVQTVRNESNNSRASSGPVPPMETRLRAAVVAGVNTMLRPGQNLNDHSKLLYSTKFSVNSGVNSVVL